MEKKTPKQTHKAGCAFAHGVSGCKAGNKYTALKDMIVRGKAEV